MLKLSEGIYECEENKECRYKDEYNNHCRYYDLADSYLYHMGETPTPACMIKVKPGDKVSLSLDSI